jgi:hypothetical protein
MEDVQTTLAFDVHLAAGVDVVVVDVYDLDDRAFAEEKPATKKTAAKKTTRQAS